MTIKFIQQMAYEEFVDLSMPRKIHCKRHVFIYVFIHLEGHQNISLTSP